MHYKITLTPLERFFFGGENVFGSDKGQDERRRSYLVKSNLLPQQTSLLGMLREQLLTQNGLLMQSNFTAAQLEQAKTLVGASGFSPKQGEAPYGVIENISPVVISDESGTIWQPCPLDDRKMADRHQELRPLLFSMDMGSGKPELKNLNPKEEMDLLFGNGQDQQKPLSQFFAAFEQVGITMTNRLKHQHLSLEERKESFYRQTFRGNSASAYGEANVTYEKRQRGENVDSKPTSDYSFIFWATMSPAINEYRFQDTIVYMGGERSAFKMRIEAVNEGKTLDEYLPALPYRHNKLSPDLKSRFQRIVLLSDAYADWSLIRKNSAFAVTQVVPFRFFTTVLGQTTHFYDFKQDAAHTKQQSGLHSLLQRGSVFYVEGEEKLMKIKKELDDQKAFHNIGYNYYYQTN